MGIVYFKDNFVRQSLFWAENVMIIFFGSSKALFATDYRDNSEGGASILEKRPTKQLIKITEEHPRELPAKHLIKP